MGAKKSKDKGGEAKPGKVKGKKKGKVLSVLVAGAAQSGKSTFFKQLQLIHFDNTFTDEQRSEVMKTLRSNLIMGFKELVEAADGMKKVKFSSASKESVEFFRQKNPFDAFDDSTSDNATQLWGDKGFKKVWAARDTIPKFSIMHLEYLVEHIERISTDDEEPTTEDVLLARKRTTGTNEIEFEFKGKDFRFVDVGGQRSERRHWDQIIDKPDAVVFFASLIDWNLPTVGNAEITKLQESASIWEEVIQMEVFSASFFILMLNKVDLFKEKILRIPLKDTFTNYEGDAEDPDAAADFIRDYFLARFPEGHAESVQTHVTCALDTAQIKVVFGAMQTAMLERLMSNFGML
eukprot:TRINITY_DN1977_c0_g2_i1.p1 TRINITY_DN1977_c0_g2~~TRINITY_DN1977_c0_g2_i1.p1  ORF type:complete len:349 (+),score=94.60 TRINITY_DN1977_c0_g2_i1:156-1202(+)